MKRILFQVIIYFLTFEYTIKNKSWGWDVLKQIVIVNIYIFNKNENKTHYKIFYILIFHFNVTWKFLYI